MTLCEEKIIFWEVSRIGSEVTGLFWNLFFFNTPPGYSFSGYSLVTLVSDSGSRLLFLSLIHKV